MRRNRIMGVCIAVSAMLSGAVMTQADEKSANERAAMLEKVWSQLETGDSFAAAAIVEAEGEPLVVAQLYSNLVRDLYGTKHDVPRMIMIGRSGAAYCLAQSNAAAERGDEALAAELKGKAKEISYNLSVNCWPAWEDEGIAITKSDQRFGLDSARLTLRLAVELKRSDDKVGGAHWLLGAHYLALKNHREAIEHLEQAAKLYKSGSQPDGEQMCLGFVAIARLGMNSKDTNAQQKLDEAIAALKEIGTDDAKFYADQLVAVNKFFAKRPGAR